MSPTVLNIFCLVFVLVGAGIIAYGIRLIREAKASLSWPVVDGQVLHSEVTSKVERSSSSSKNSGHTYRTVYQVELTYQYDIAGAMHHGSRITVSDGTYSRHASAMAVAARYPKGAKVTVRYRPDKPEVALLEPGARASTWIVPLAGVLFLAAGVIVYILVTPTK